MEGAVGHHSVLHRLSRDKVDLRMLSQQKDQADAGRVW